MLYNDFVYIANWKKLKRQINRLKKKGKLLRPRRVRARGYFFFDEILLNHLKYSLSLQKQNVGAPTLLTLLSLIKLSQGKEYRINYYNYCCFLSRFTTIYYKPYAVYLWDKMDFGKISLLKKNIRSFKGLDSYYYTGPYVEMFRGDDFFYPTYDYPYLLPYKNYILKIKSSAFVLLWSLIEAIRTKYYNSYVRTHNLLHIAGKYNKLRARYINPLERAPRYFPSLPEKGVLRVPLLWYKLRHFVNLKTRIWYNYLRAISKKKTRILTYIMTNRNLQNISNYSLGKIIMKYHQKSLDFNSKLVSHWKAVTINNNKRLFRTLRISLSMLPTMTFGRYLHRFYDHTRMGLHRFTDYTFLLATTDKSLLRFVRLESIMVQKANLKKTVNDHYIQFFLLIYNWLTKTRDTTWDRFKNNIITLNINDNKFGLSLRTLIHFVNIIFINETMFTLYDYEQILWLDTAIEPIEEWIAKFLLTGIYYKVNNILPQTVSGLEYYYWRSYSPDHIFLAHKGRLTIMYYLNKLDIDLLLAIQLRTINLAINKIWTKYWFITPPLAKAKSRPKPLLTNIAISSVLQLITMRTIHWIKQSVFLSFFAIFDSILKIKTAEYYERKNQNIINFIFRAHYSIRKYLKNYTTIYRDHRRAALDEVKGRRVPLDSGKGTCIHGKDSFLLENWLWHVNWMRIIGLKKFELPYFCYNEGEDFIEQLYLLGRKDRVTIAPWVNSNVLPQNYNINIATSNLFTIVPDGEKIIKVNPKINSISKLYER